MDDSTLVIMLTSVYVLISFLQLSSAECGIVNNGNRIIGGTEVKNFKYPWFGSLILKRNNIVNCAGSLITNRYFISAAHCFYGSPNPEQLYTVVLGTNNICNISTTAERFGTEKVIMHEDYKRQRPFSDIALIYLNRTADHFEKICLSPATFFQPRFGSVIGFGVTETGKTSCELKEVKIRVYTRMECILDTNLTPEDIGTGTICAGRILGGADSCQGDSGGPLQYVMNNKYYLLGIVSFGFGCAEVGYPGIYTDVRHYNSWINRQINHIEPSQNTNKRPYWWWTIAHMIPYFK